MELTFNRQDSWAFQTGHVLVRGKVFHAGQYKCAVVAIPEFIKGRELTDDEIEDFAKTLLAVEFLAGRWYSPGESGLNLHNGKMTISGGTLKRKPIRVEV